MGATMDAVGHLPEIALAIGGLGLAAYGFVDGLKLVAWVDLAGFERLFGDGGHGGRRWPVRQPTTLRPLLPALELAYGSQALEMLKAQYRGGRSKGDLPRTLRQGVRIGFGLMGPDGIAAAARALGVAEPVALAAADAVALERSASLRSEAAAPASAGQRASLAQLETAIDARIDAALLLAEAQYATQQKVLAMLVALAIAAGVGAMLGAAWHLRLIVGLAAVPLAPVAKDLATALQEAAKALKAR